MAGELLLIEAFPRSLYSVDEFIYSLFILCLYINYIPPQFTHPSLSVHEVFVV